MKETINIPKYYKLQTDNMSKFSLTHQYCNRKHNLASFFKNKNRDKVIDSIKRGYWLQTLQFKSVVYQFNTNLPELFPEVCFCRLPMS